MEAKFLRKIIMEELKNVLKEDWFTQNVADDTDTATYTPYQKETPVSSEKELDLGTTTFVGKKPNRAVVALQKDLNATGKYNLVPDGILGKETLKAVRKEVGWRGAPKDLLANVEKIRGQLVGAISYYNRKKQNKMASASQQKTEETPISPGDSGLPKSPADVDVPFTDKATMDKMIGPRKGFTTDPDALKDTGPKKQDDELKQEALVRAINKLLKKL